MKLFDAPAARTPLQILRLWADALRVLRPFLLLAAAPFLLAPVQAFFITLPPQLIGNVVDMVKGGSALQTAAERLRAPVSLSCTAPFPFQGVWSAPAMPLWGAVGVILIVSIVAMPVLTMAVNYASTSARFRISRELQTQLLTRFLEEAGRGVQRDAGEISIAVQSFGSLLAAVVATRIPSWLTLILSAVNAGKSLYQTGRIEMFGLVTVWGLAALVLPRFLWRGSTGGGGASSSGGSSSGGGAGEKKKSGNLDAVRASLAATQMRQNVEFQSYLLDLTTGLPTVISLRLEQPFIQRLRGLVTEQRVLAIKSMRVSFLSTMFGEAAGGGNLAALLYGIWSGHPATGGGLVNVFMQAQLYISSLRSVETTFGLEIESSIPVRATISILEQKPPGKTLSLKAPPRIELERLTVEVDMNGTRTRLLDGVSLVIPGGEVFGVYGKTGAGKSSLHRVLMGMVPITDGQVKVGDTVFGPGERVPLLGAVTIIAQFAHLFRGTVEENILLGCDRPEMPLEEALTRAGFVDADERSKHLKKLIEPPKPPPLAGGEQKRVMLARALVRPLQPVLLVDEVDSGLDDATATRVLGNLYEWARHKSTGLVISHKPELFPAEWFLHVESGRYTVVSRADAFERAQAHA